MIYEGSFTIANTTPSGTAYAVFSARDMAGKRGTEILSGGQILIDTRGPVVSRLEIAPASPVKNDYDNPVAMTFILGLTEQVKTGTTPSVTLTLSATGDVPDTAVITPADPETGEGQAWQAVITLPKEAGQADAETATIQFSGRDDLDNLSTAITPVNQFQVYQGGLPPLAPPSSLTAKAAAGGIITLTWDAVEDAAGYQIYCKAPGEADLTLLETIEATTTHTHQTTLDGTYTYAVATIRIENQEESVSGLSDTVTASADATAPNARNTVYVRLEIDHIYNSLGQDSRPGHFTCAPLKIKTSFDF